MQGQPADPGDDRDQDKDGQGAHADSTAAVSRIATLARGAPLRKLRGLATVAAMRTLLSMVVVMVGCSAPEVADRSELGREIPPAPGGESDPNVAVRAPDPPPRTTPAAPAQPALPTTSAIKTDAPVDVAGPPADAVRAPSGLAYKILRPGDGALASAESTVSVHYAGWTTDGNLFDSSIPRAEALTIGLHQVIEGWRQGVAGMKTGEIRRLWIPEKMAYGGREGAPKGMLVFDVELLRVE
ncbi:MAG: FKBP-type peptidyl-prolyl cis-trans isomerase [Deltaproteobacteria bacterium]|nr:FKBP-type peptidyl-prolyl cis-trans isomerase [Deltaproteobacteria bacterium]